MKNQLSFFPIVAVFSAISVSCGLDKSHSDTNSKIKDISYSADGQSYLFYGTDKKVTLGKCANSQIQSPSNCPAMAEKETSELSNLLTTKFAEELKEVEAQKDAEILVLTSKDAVVVSLRENVLAVSKVIAQIESTQIPAILKDINDQKIARDAIVLQTDYLKTQIQNINDQLKQTPQNSELLELQSRVTIELIEAELKKMESDENILNAETELEKAKTALSRKVQEKSQSEDWLKQRLANINVSSEALDKINAQKTLIVQAQSEFPGVLQKISKTGIAFRYDRQSRGGQKVLVSSSDSLKTPSEFIKLGQYINKGPYNSFCNQAVKSATVKLGQLKELTLTLCDPAKPFVFACDSSKKCVNVEQKWTLQVISDTSYEFINNDNNKSVFTLSP